MMACLKYLSISVIAIILTSPSAYASKEATKNNSYEKKFTLLMRHIHEMDMTEDKEKVFAQIRIEGKIRWLLDDTVKNIVIELTEIKRSFSHALAEKTSPKFEPFTTEIVINPQQESPVAIMLVTGRSDSEIVRQSQYMVIYMILDMLLESGEHIIEQPKGKGMGLLKIMTYESFDIDGIKGVKPESLRSYSQKTSFNIIPDIKEAKLKGLHLVSDAGNNYYYRYTDNTTGIVDHAINFEAVPADSAPFDYLKILGKTQDVNLFQYLDYSELMLQ